MKACVILSQVYLSRKKWGISSIQRLIMPLKWSRWLLRHFLSRVREPEPRSRYRRLQPKGGSLRRAHLLLKVANQVLRSKSCCPPHKKVRKRRRSRRLPLSHIIEKSPPLARLVSLLPSGRKKRASLVLSLTVEATPIMDEWPHLQKVLVK